MIQASTKDHQQSVSTLLPTDRMARQFSATKSLNILDDFLQKELPLINEIHEWNKDVSLYLQSLINDPSIVYSPSYSPLLLDIERMY